MQLFKKLKLFCDSFFYFWNLHQILNVWKKKMIVIANLFLELQTVKDIVRSLSNKRCFRTPLDSQHVKVFQTFVKSSRDLFLTFFFIALRETDLENVSLCYMWNRRGVWLAMTSIIFWTVRVCGSQFKWNYLENEKIFLDFWFHFWSLH